MPSGLFFTHKPLDWGFGVSQHTASSATRPTETMTGSIVTESREVVVWHPLENELVGLRLRERDPDRYEY